jgi:Zn-dependent peptidase ImmA (M78 family)
VLLNGADSGADLRFSLAHESAHFLLDYLNPRQRAVRRLGPTILEVFDGRRPPTVKERVHAILGRVPVGFHAHMLERREKGVVGLAGELEDSADLLALELLAPEVEVRNKVHHLHLFQNQAEVTGQVLQKDFGLPPKVAGVYASWLYPRVRVHSVQAWLRQKT